MLQQSSTLSSALWEPHPYQFINRYRRPTCTSCSNTHGSNKSTQTPRYSRDVGTLCCMLLLKNNILPCPHELLPYLSCEMGEKWNFCSPLRRNGRARRTARQLLLFYLQLFFPLICINRFHFRCFLHVWLRTQINVFSKALQSEGSTMHQFPYYMLSDLSLKHTFLLGLIISTKVLPH